MYFTPIGPSTNLVVHDLMAQNTLWVTRFFDGALADFPIALWFGLV